MVFSKEEGRGGRCVQWLYKQKKRSQDVWHQACLSAFHMHSQTPHDWERSRWNCSARLHQISRQPRGSDPIVLHYEHRTVVGFVIFRSIKEQKMEMKPCIKWTRQANTSYCSITHKSNKVEFFFPFGLQMKKSAKESSRLWLLSCELISTLRPNAHNTENTCLRET